MTRPDALLLLLLVTLLVADGALGIKCYECVHNSQRMKRQQRYVYPCYEFDGGDLYVRDCPDSELCIYQHISLRLASETVVTVHTMDGCTPNSTSLSRYSEAGLVKAGCIQHLSRYKPPSSIYCYCDYDLCNGPLNAGGPATAPNHWQTMGAAVWVLWVLLPALHRPGT
ncbi:hypothetical protein FHG87_005377 [Trinorchestia longiramus]|nr:hypothetical protein FHG87_005377 [Trinorchestia longiramus]